VHVVRFLEWAESDSDAADPETAGFGRRRAAIVALTVALKAG